MNSSTPPLLSEIQDTIQLLESTSQQLSGDTLLDLTWLERRVSFLCSQTDSLTPQDREPARQALEKLTGILDTLESALQERIQTLQSSSGGTDPEPPPASKAKIYQQHG